MFYIYLLLGSDNKKYIGYTSNLKRRIKEHKNNKTCSTSKFKKIELFYYEAFFTEKAAKEREKKLKQYGSSYQGLLKRLELKNK